eukprot:gene33023-42722_t
MLDNHHDSESSDSSQMHRRTLLNIDSVIGLSNTVHLNPKKSYSKIIPKARIRCLSCSKESLEDLRHAVTYKSLIKHFDHVMHLLIETTNGTKRDAISWPPDPETIEAAGGVSFGCMFMNEKGELLSQRELDHLNKIKLVKDLQIPCIIQYLHPKLTTKSYLQCKKDPLFLYKTVHVCESCFLVYAEFTVMLLKMGGDLHKLLTPDPAADFSIAMSAVSPSRNTIRPSSAEWRAISSTAGSVGQTRSASVGSISHPSSYDDDGFHAPSVNHKHAKESAIGLRTSDVRSQPEVPKIIRTASDSSDLLISGVNNTRQLPDQNGSLAPGSPLSHNMSNYRGSNDSVSSMGSSLYYDPQEVKTMIAERERIFFKEISMNPQLKDQHPLMHMLSAQQKLKLADQSSVVARSEKDPEVFSSKYGTQNGIKTSASPYGNEQPYILNGEIILPSKLKQRKAEEIAKARRETMQRQKSFKLPPSPSQQQQHYTDDDTINTASVLDTGDDDQTMFLRQDGKKGSLTQGDPNVEASIKHREFLNESLKKIEEELLEVNTTKA